MSLIKFEIKTTDIEESDIEKEAIIGVMVIRVRQSPAVIGIIIIL